MVIVETIWSKYNYGCGNHMKQIQGLYKLTYSLPKRMCFCRERKCTVSNEWSVFDEHNSSSVKACSVNKQFNIYFVNGEYMLISNSDFVSNIIDRWPEIRGKDFKMLLFLSPNKSVYNRLFLILVAIVTLSKIVDAPSVEFSSIMILYHCAKF